MNQPPTQPDAGTPTPTPRTDAAIDKGVGPRCFVDSDFARTLERELHEARNQWRMSSVNRELADQLSEAVSERDSLRAQLAAMTAEVQKLKESKK